MPGSETRRERLRGLAPVLSGTARVLILGSMPGARSLADGRYYAHPRNAFWPIMTRFLAIPASAGYERRLAALCQARIALWDVIGRCTRYGSLDAKIDPASIEVNDFAALFETCPQITRILFNGRTAEASFRRHVQPALAARGTRIERITLPSTSPAHAAMSPEQKYQRWREALCPSQPGRCN